MVVLGCLPQDGAPARKHAPVTIVVVSGKP
jgi:hypothetical protein